MKWPLKHFFVPHHGNDHKPHFLREEAVSATLAVVIGLFVLTLAGRAILPQIDFIAAIYPSVLVDLANENRQENGLSTLTINEQLQEAAQLKAEHMDEHDYFAHISPDGVDPWYWMREAGYRFAYAGENLAIDFHESEAVAQAWMDSPSHRANILGERFTEIGIAVHRGEVDGRNTRIVVQMFGTPAASRAEPPAETEVAVTDPAEEQEDAGSVAGEESGGAPDVSAETDTVEQPADGGVDRLARAEPVAGVAEPDDESLRVLYSDSRFIAVEDTAASPTATQGGAALSSSEAPRYSSLFERLLVEPTRLVQIIYVGLAAVIFAVLAVMILVEFRKQHPVNVAYGCLLLVIIGSMLYVNEALMRIGSTTLF